MTNNDMEEKKVLEEEITFTEQLIKETKAKVKKLDRQISVLEKKRDKEETDLSELITKLEEYKTKLWIKKLPSKNTLIKWEDLPKTIKDEIFHRRMKVAGACDGECRDCSFNCSAIARKEILEDKYGFTNYQIS